MNTETIVDALLAAASLTVSAEERAAFVADYPRLREATDALFEFHDGLEPPLIFDPTTYYRNSPSPS